MEPTTSSLSPLHANGGSRRARDHWSALKRGWRGILAITLIAVAAAALATWLQRDVYEGEAMLRIEESTSGGLSLAMGDMVPPGMGSIAGLGGGGKIDADIMVLRSRSMAEQVVDSLHLHVLLVKPAAPRSAVVRVLDAPRDARPGIFELAHQGGGAYRLVGVPGGSGVEVRPNEPVRLGDVLVALTDEVARDPVEVIRLEVAPFREAVKALREDLQVLRPDQSAPMVTLRYQTTDPVLAASVPNALTARFIEYKTEVTQADARGTTEFLREQLTTYAAQLRDAEDQLESFRQNAQVINPSAQSEEQVRQLAELQAQRDQLAADRASLRSLFSRLRAASRAESMVMYRQLAAYPAFLSNGAVQNILQALTSLENQRAELLVLRTADHEDVKAYDHRIAALERQLYDLAQNYLNSLDDQLASVTATMDRHTSQLATIPAREVEFLRLARQEKLMEQVYTLLQTRLKEAEIQSAGEAEDVRVIDASLIPYEPVYPRPAINLGLGALVGLLLGVATVLAREAMHPAVRSRQDIWEATAGAPLLGQIPAPRLYPNGNGRLRGRGTARPPAALWLDPASPTSDAYRALGTSLTLMRGEGTPQLLVVTSARAEEGNDVGTANLAVAVAQRGVRTLLVDADLRAAPLHRLLDAPPGPGLADVLAGRVEVTEAVRRLSLGETDTELDFLAAGSTTAHGTELLGSGSMRELLAELRASYQLVIFHTASLDAAADAELLGQRTDATVLVARFGVTQKEALQLASARLGQLGIPLLGVILSDAEIVRGGPSLQRLAYT